MRPDWEDEAAEPNGIGPICRHCQQLIDWHPYDHAEHCPEWRPGRPPTTSIYDE